MLTVVENVASKVTQGHSNLHRGERRVSLYTDDVNAIRLTQLLIYCHQCDTGRALNAIQAKKQLTIHQHRIVKRHRQSLPM